MICKLCKNERELCDSHIIPEFFYKPLYDNNHRLKRKAFAPNMKIKKIYDQKGVREKLLCKDCENLLNVNYELYASQVHREKLLNLLDFEVHKLDKLRFIQINSIDYIKFKLFQLSIIWRCGITSNEMFSIDLGIHEENLRKMILGCEPGDEYEYGCIMSVLINDNNEILDDIIWLETDFRIHGHRCYRLLFGGFIWIFFISSHKPHKSDIELFLKKNGTIKIFIANLSEIDFFMKRAKKLDEAGEL